MIFIQEAIGVTASNEQWLSSLHYHLTYIQSSAMEPSIKRPRVGHSDLAGCFESSSSRASFTSQPNPMPVGSDA